MFEIFEHLLQGKLGVHCMSSTASIAQLVERPLSELEVVGSNPKAAPYQRCKNGTSSSLADARINWAVLGR